MVLRRVAGGCDDGYTCPAVFVDGEAETVVVQGYRVEDGATLGELQLPEAEGAVRIPAAVLMEAARALEAGKHS